MANEVNPANVQPEAEVSTEQEGIMGAISSHSDLVKFDVNAMDAQETEVPAEEAAVEEEEEETPTETEELTEQETETETETETEAEAEEEAEPEELEEVDEAVISLEEMKKGQDYINKKIGKAHSKRKQAEGEAEQLRGELVTAREQLVQAQQIDPVAALQTMGMDASLVMPPDQLQSEYQKLNQMHRQTKLAALNPDGFEENGKHYSQQEVMQQQFAVEERMDQVRHAFGVAQQRTAAEQEVKQIYPELYDGTSEQAVGYAAAMRAVPGLHALPRAGEAVGDMLIGQKVRAALEAGEGSLFTKVDELLGGKLTLGTMPPAKPKAKAKAAEVTPAVVPKAKAKQARPTTVSAIDSEAFEKRPTRETLMKLDAQAMR